MAIYPAAKPASPEDSEQIIHVNTIEDGTQNCSLSDTISHGEEVGDQSIPSDIGKLVDINEDQKSNKYQRQSS